MFKIICCIIFSISGLIALIPVQIPAQDLNKDHSIGIAGHDDCPLFEEGHCPFHASQEQLNQIRCGWLTVPENHSEPDGSHLRLAVAIVSSLSDDPEPDPLVYIPGGPGTAGVCHRSVYGVRFGKLNH